MITCDVLVVGGGPAGSTCAWQLRRGGLDVLVADRAAFPRDKPCAGWITPQTIDDLALDLDEYRRGRTLQAIAGFRIGMIGGARDVTAAYDRPVSFGLRRCEFDDFLLRRSGARLVLGTAVVRLRRDRGSWIVNDDIRAPMLVGAGGHFCAVAAWLNGPRPYEAGAPLVAAQEAEFPIEPADGARVDGGAPEFYFARDLGGYGWCCRKQQYLNVGFGRVVDRLPIGDRRALPADTQAFVDFLVRRGRLARRGAWRWRGHAYLLRGGAGRRVSGPGVLLVGDAAGLAYPQSGEGIRPAVESGLLAARTILEAAGSYADLSAYEARLDRRFGAPSATLGPRLPPQVVARAGRLLLGIPWFVRRVVLERWFLHAGQPALVT